MSEPPRAGASAGRTQLETVTSWPLVASVAFAIVSLVVMAALIPQGELPESAYPPFPATESAASSHPHHARPLPRRAAPAEDEGRWDEDSSFVSRVPRSDDEASLNASLLAASLEVDLESEPGDSLVLWLVGRQHARDTQRSRDGEPRASLSEPIEWLLQVRQDLRGLPLLTGEACRVDKEQLRALIDVSFRVSRLQGPLGRSSSALLEADLRDCLACLGERTEQIGDRKLLVRPLEQTFQIEGPAVRTELMKTLSTIDGKEATEAIARRAVFDPSRRVREAAVESLRWRDATEAREVFLAALRHPWAPAADHAALALAALRDEGAAGRLRELMHEPDPSAPFNDGDGRWKRSELVRVNHLRNCLLCHPPSVSPGDELVGPVPTTGEPLREGYHLTPTQMLVVRADVVYFRQDFSAMHEVDVPGRWPKLQRFDYLVQKRELTECEAEWALELAAKRKTYPQREAVRWALAHLTGKRAR
jgi:hypothetical protein